MGKLTESLDHKRELLYSFVTVIFTPVLYYFAVTSAFNSLPLLSDGVGGTTVIDADQNAELPAQDEHEGSSSSNNHDINNTSSSQVNVIQYVLKLNQLPVETVSYIFLFEVLKLVIVFSLYPAHHLFDPNFSSKLSWSNLRYSTGLTSTSPSSSSSFSSPSNYQNNRGGGNSGTRAVPGRLPFKREKEHLPFHTSTQGHNRIWVMWKGLCNYLVGCVVCHVFVVLLGAPIINDWKLTFQFSVILTTWLFSPLCLAVQPGKMLEELTRIKSWSLENNEMLWRAKWRFAITVFGAWIGAVVIPLDWDRPWQKWPIPCLASTTFTFLILNLVLALHLFCTIFEIYKFIPSLVRNKIKKI